MKIVEKPWGHEEWWAVTDKYVGKLLFIKQGHRLSLQYHNIKEETMRVISGVLTFVLGDETMVLYPGESVHVPPGTIHRMEAKTGDVSVIEVSTPELDDVVRVQDDYARLP
jgi:mannose-6-phosphate isomerase-like protein (cupin superfamily)